MRTLRPAHRGMTQWPLAIVLILVGSLLMAGGPVAYAQTGEEGSVPDRPGRPSGSALWVGMIDLHWDEVPAADSYNVQYFHISRWIDLPADDEDNVDIDIAFYGAGAVVRGLRPTSTYTFRVRAANSHGASEWSEYGWVPQTDGPGAWVNVSEPTNCPATGAPVFNGTQEVGETLAVDISGISDENGLDRVKFHYQWVSSDGTTDTYIEGATEPSHTFTEADQGKTIKVRVRFTDRHGFAESLVYDPSSNVVVTVAPIICGTPQVGETLTASTSGISDEDGLDNATFSYQWLRNDGTTDSDIQDATTSAYTLVSEDLGKGIKVQVSYTDDGGNKETLTSEATASIVAKPNNPATGAPSISGTVQVGGFLPRPRRASPTRTDWITPPSDISGFGTMEQRTQTYRTRPPRPTRWWIRTKARRSRFGSPSPTMQGMRRH